jgi:hypothetical protein
VHVIYLAVEFDGTLAGIHKSMNAARKEIQELFLLRGMNAGARGNAPTAKNKRSVAYNFLLATQEDENVSLAQQGEANGH